MNLPGQPAFGLAVTMAERTWDLIKRFLTNGEHSTAKRVIWSKHFLHLSANCVGRRVAASKLMDSL